MDIYSEKKAMKDLNSLYAEAVYGKPKSAGQELASREKRDDAAGAPKKMIVTRADKKANTKAYQNYKAGAKGYAAADHLKNEEYAELYATMNEKKADKDYDGDGKVESGKEEYFGSKDKAIKKAMGKKVKEEVEEVDEAMSSYDKARKAAARRAADRNAARRRGEMGGRMERETYTNEAGKEMHYKGYSA